jgi:hypothetical protein
MMEKRRGGEGEWQMNQRRRRRSPKGKEAKSIGLRGK